MALSYVWGDQDPAALREIVVNDTIIKVGNNLEAALHELQSSVEVSSGLKLWVGSLCIDQGDLQERSRQVKRTQEIYARAWTAIVWLGTAENESDKVMDLITVLSLRYRGMQDPLELRSP